MSKHNAERFTCSVWNRSTEYIARALQNKTKIAHEIAPVNCTSRRVTSCEQCDHIVEKWKKKKHLKMKATYRTCGKINMENWRLYIITCGNPLYFEMCETTCEETRWLFTCDDKCDFKGQCIGIFVYLFLCHEWNREKVWRERERERYPCSSYSSEFYSASFVLTCRCVCVDLQFLQDCRWWQTS